MGIDLRLLRSPSAVAQVAPGTRTRPAGDSIVRFDEHQRLQHVLMMSSFIVLALTGLPQKFSDLPLSQWWVASLGGLQVVRAIHRTAGLIMLSDCVYHLGYLAYRIGVQRRLGALRMLPGPRDARDVCQTLLYFLGVQAEKPRFDRFNYLEKFDYWAVFWGIFMIGGSGLVLTFPVLATSFLPGQVIPVAITIHSDEAILAVGWILVVHMFNVHLAPWVFPFNPAIFTGKMTARRYAEDHPLEWERITSARRAPSEEAAVDVPPPAAMTRRQPARLLALAGSRAAVGADGALKCARALRRKLALTLRSRRTTS